MVVESFLKSQFALKHPVSMVFFGIVITVISAGISLSTFPAAASVLSIALITIGAIPLFNHVLDTEEDDETKSPGNPATFLGRHFHLISVYWWFFVGVIIASAYLQAELSPTLSNQLFAEQTKTYDQIAGLRGNATEGDFLNSCAGNDYIGLSIGCIFKNNAVVLAWTLLFSLLYGVGALFLITWNASVIATVIGKELIQKGLENAATKTICLIPHGIPEIAAYFIGAIAGGIISAAVAKKLYQKNEFTIIFKDVVLLILLAFAILLIGALIEGHSILTKDCSDGMLALVVLAGIAAIAWSKRGR